MLGHSKVLHDVFTTTQILTAAESVLTETEQSGRVYIGAERVIKTGLLLGGTSFIKGLKVLSPTCNPRSWTDNARDTNSAYQRHSCVKTVASTAEVMLVWRHTAAPIVLDWSRSFVRTTRLMMISGK
ncbi:hypothetical protein Bbelb_039570 [Branchiostoma belcheri]|nr:hypothetical protein Bbelb_039570 [Branchiostoma belcheri]